ncbi:dTMP kinase [Candidatus Woesearchaeota archaeon]|nr:dTMP kinase [Candidatus Woesearchaeota archaeon]
MTIFNFDEVYNIVNEKRENKADFILKLLKKLDGGRNTNYSNLPPIIIVDGMDGAGKGVYKNIIIEYLISRGYKVDCIKEPGDYMRKEILKTINKKGDPWVAAALFILDRKYQFNKLTECKFDKKTVLIFDRSYISTLVYQSVQGIDFNVLFNLHDFVPKHKMAFIFICDPEVARKRVLERAVKEGKIVDEFEKLQFLKKTREGFTNVINHILNSYLIDTTGDEKDIPEIFEKVRKILDEKIDF